jgi:hypothetical protein
VSEKVKRVVVEKGVEDPVLGMLQDGDPFEKEAAAMAVWTLAFSKDNRLAMRVSEWRWARGRVGEWSGVR